MLNKKAQLIAILISSFTWTLAICQNGKMKIPMLQKEDIDVLTESYNLLKTKGDKIWDGWAESSIPIIYRKKEFEYWINFPKGSSEGKFMGYLDKMPIYGKEIEKKDTGKTIASDLDINKIQTVVLSSPELLGISKEDWVMKAIHEMFHNFQYSKCFMERINDLKLAYGSDGSWMLTYPFPYKDSSISTITHLLGYLSYKIYYSDSLEETRYDCFLLQETNTLYKKYLNYRYSSDHDYWYSVLQQSLEGVAKYTELKMMEIAALDYVPLDTNIHFTDHFSGQYNVVKHCGRATYERITFYYLGLGKCLVLDKINPGWKKDYFKTYWLDEIISNSLISLMKE